CAGGGFSCVIRNDGPEPGMGSIIAWGRVADVLPGKDFVRVRGGNKHNIALKADGSAVGFGSDNKKQTSSATETAKGLMMVAGAGYRNVGLRADGTLQAFPPKQVFSARKDYVFINGGYGCPDHFIRADGSLERGTAIKKGVRQDVLPGKNFVAVAPGYY